MRVVWDEEPSVRPELSPLVACVATCLPHLEELSLDMGGLWCRMKGDAYPSILASLAGLPHLATLSIAYPGRVTIDVFQAGSGGLLAYCSGPCVCLPVKAIVGWTMYAHGSTAAMRTCLCMMCSGLQTPPVGTLQ